MVFCASALVAALFATGVVAAPSAATKQACDEIADSLPRRVSLRFAPSYTFEVGSYWSIALREAKPACLVLPESAEEVAAAVKVLNKYPTVQFAVKSGGHTPNERHSSIQDGVLISTKNLAGTTYDPQSQLAYVKPGGEWNDVIGALDKQGVTVVGGRLGLVGVGGYLLQGGISFLSSQYGLGADSIVGWEVVLANGTIKNVDAAKDPELAVALRGSGSQFGIVTKYTIQTHPIGKVWGGTRMYDAKKAPELYAALHEFTAKNAEDEKAAVIFTDIIAAGGIKLFLLFYFYDGPEPPKTGPLARFLEIGSTLSTTKTQSYSQLLKTNGQGSELLLARISFRTFTIPYIAGKPEIYKEISEKFNSLVLGYLKSPLRLTSQCSVDFQPFPSIIGKHSVERGGNALGISGSDPDRILLEIQCSWAIKSDDKIFVEASKELVKWLEVKVPEWTDGKEYYLPFLMNDAAGDQNVTGMYRDYGKFKALQATLDPDQFFKSRGGGFVY